MTDIWLVSYLVLWVLVLGEALAIMALARQIGLLHTRLGPTGARMTNAGLELGNVAPPVSERDLNGQLVTLGVERNKPTLLIFISPNCSVCAELIPAIRAVYHHEQKYIDFIVVSLLEDEAENRAYIKRHRLNGIPYVISSQIAEAYQVASAPYAILVNAEGKIQTKGLANHREHLESLLNALDEGYASFDSKMNALKTKQEALEGYEKSI
ncbi:MAG: redoxin domain-containing protein [Gammaproteobacteria bacterium]|nr:redoxin domain-containing protein [Gammaproteobacteria bacterium]